MITFFALAPFLALLVQCSDSEFAGSQPVKSSQKQKAVNGDAAASGDALAGEYAIGVVDGTSTLGEIQSSSGWTVARATGISDIDGELSAACPWVDPADRTKLHPSYIGSMPGLLPDKDPPIPVDTAKYRASATYQSSDDSINFTIKDVGAVIRLKYMFKAMRHIKILPASGKCKFTYKTRFGNDGLMKIYPYSDD